MLFESKWITYKTGNYKSADTKYGNPAPYFRQKFTLKKGVKKGMNSFNHYSLGSCTEWMYGYCLGIRPCVDNPAFKKVKFAPCFDLSKKITSAKGHYDTDYGTITAEWKSIDGVFEYTVSVPREIKCEFDFAGMKVLSQKCENGVYVYRLKDTKTLE